MNENAETAAADTGEFAGDSIHIEVRVSNGTTYIPFTPVPASWPGRFVRIQLVPPGASLSDAEIADLFTSVSI